MLMLELAVTGYSDFTMHPYTGWPCI